MDGPQGDSEFTFISPSAGHSTFSQALEVAKQLVFTFPSVLYFNETVIQDASQNMLAHALLAALS